MEDDRLYLSRGERALAGRHPRRKSTLLLFLAVFGVCFLAVLGGLFSVLNSDEPANVDVAEAPAIPLAMNSRIEPAPVPAPDAPAPVLPEAPAATGGSTAPAVALVAAPAAAPPASSAPVQKAPAPKVIAAEPTRRPVADLDALAARLAAEPNRDLPDDPIIDEPRFAAAPPAPGRRRAPAGPAARPAFSCAQPLSPTERMICAEPALARADRQLEAAFRRSLQLSDNPQRLVRDQNRWLAQRERLGQDYASVMDHYDQRIDELAIVDYDE